VRPLELALGAVASTHTHKQPPPFANPISRESSPLESACFDFSPSPATAAVEFELDFQASPTEISSLQALEEEEEEEERTNEPKNERTKERKKKF